MFGSQTTRPLLGNPQLDSEAHQLYNTIVEDEKRLDGLQKTKKLLEHDKAQFTDDHIATVNKQKSLFEEKMSEQEKTFAAKSLEEDVEFKQHLLERSCQIATINKKIEHISTELKRLTNKVEASQPDQTTGKPSSTASQYTIFLNDYR